MSLDGYNPSYLDKSPRGPACGLSLLKTDIGIWPFVMGGGRYLSVWEIYRKGRTIFLWHGMDIGGMRID